MTRSLLMLTLTLLTGAAYAAESAPTPVPLQNPGFEDGLKPWHNNGGVPKGAAKEDAVSVIADTEAGSQVLEIRDPWTNCQPYVIQYFTTPVAPDMRLNLAFRAKAEKGQVFTAGFQFSGNKKYLGGRSANFTGTGAWQEYSANFTNIPADTDKFAVALHVTPWNHKNTGTIRYDDIRISVDKAPKAAPKPAPEPAFRIPYEKIGKRKLAVKDRHLDTFLVRSGKPAAAIVGDAKLAAKINAAVKAKTGVELEVLPHTAYEYADKLDRDLIVLGSRDSSRTMSNLYSFHFALIDGKYPGKGGYDVHSLHNPFGDLHNVILAGGSDPQGDADAADVLVKHIEKAPKGAELKLGFISDAKLSPAYKVARDVKDIPLWECSYGYGSKGYFGWNSLARNLAMLYITNDPYYKNEFMRLAFPKDAATRKELFERDDEAYRGSLAEPIVGVYHYRGAFMTLYWDMVDENPLFSDAERLLVAQKLYDQLSFRLTQGDYTNPYLRYRAMKLVNPDRHYTWEVLLAYTTARYLHKDYPCFETAEGLRMGRNAMEPLMERPAIDNIVLYWVPTSIEMQFYYAGLNGNRLVGNPMLKEYAKCLTLLSTLDYGWDPRVEKYGSPWLYLCGAFFAQDEAMVRLAHARTLVGWYAREPGYRYDVFRIGQSYWPSRPYPGDSVKDNLGKWCTFAPVVPSDPACRNVFYTSWRNRPDYTGDFMMIDPHYSRGLRDPQHNFAMVFSRLNGGPLLYGYENALVPYANGLAVGKYPFDAKITAQGAAEGFSWITGKVADFSGFDWERTWLLREGKFMLALDRVTARGPLKQARFDIKYTAGFQGNVKALPDGDFEANVNYYDKQYTFNWSFSDDAPGVWRKYTWGVYLPGDSVVFRPEMRDAVKGTRAEFVTLFRAGKALDTRSTARDGRRVALRTPEPAMLTIADDGFTLADAGETFRLAGGKASVSGGDPAAAAAAMKMLAARKREKFTPPALPEAMQTPRWTAKLKPDKAAGHAVLADREVAISADDTVTILDWKDGKKIAQVTLAGPVYCLAYHPQAKLWLAGTEKETLAAFDNTGKIHWKFTSQMHPKTLDYGPYWHKKAVKGVRSICVRGGLVYAGSASTVEVLTAEGKLVAREFVRYGGVDRMRLNPTNGNILVFRHSGGAALHEVTQDNRILPLENWAFGPDDNLNGYGFNQVGQMQVEFFKDASGKWIAADLLTGAQNRLVLRDPASGKALHEANFGPGSLGYFRFAAPNLGTRTLRHLALADLNDDGTPEIAVSHRDGLVYIFDAKLEVKELYDVQSRPMPLVSDGRAFYSGEEDGRIVRIDKEGLCVIGKLSSPVTLLEVLPDGRLLAGCADGTVAGY